LTRGELRSASDTVVREIPRVAARERMVGTVDISDSDRQIEGRKGAKSSPLNL